MELNNKIKCQIGEIEDMKDNDWKLPVPARFKKETADFFQENDPIKAFIKDCIVADSGSKELLKEIKSIINKVVNMSFSIDFFILVCIFLFLIIKMIICFFLLKY